MIVRDSTIGRVILVSLSTISTLWRTDCPSELQMVNQFGLSRDIPEEIKRIVRKECGFGCVTCGRPVAQYDHFDPPFADAREHKAAGIALVCGACHDKRTRGIWSSEKIAAARKSPITFAGSPERDTFDISDPLTLWVGSSSASNVRSIVRTYEGDRWLSVAAPEVPGGPVLLSAEFFDPNGALALEIRDNEWLPAIGQWDTEVEGRRITVRRAPGEIVLQLRTDPPHGFHVERLRMEKFGLGITIDPDGSVTLSRDGGVIKVTGCATSTADSVFLV
jgi:hypothetical protein